MKKIVAMIVAAIVLLESTPHKAYASNPFDQLPNFLSSRFLDPFAKDLGAVLGGGSFHNGKALGFPGVDFGVQAPVKRVDGSDDIANAAGLKYLAIPWIQAEIGLPWNFSIMARGITAYGTQAIGGGVSYGLLKSDLPGMPNISVSGTYNQLDHQFLTAHTWSANGVLSFNVPIVTPYVGFGYDRTNLKLKDAAFAGTGVSNNGIEGNAGGYRLEGGVNIGFLPFSYLTLAAGVANGEMLYHAGLGIRI